MQRRTFLGVIPFAASIPFASAWAGRAKPKSSAGKGRTKKSSRSREPKVSDDDGTWQQLFDGQTLTGWEPYVPIPNPAVAAPAAPNDLFTVVSDEREPYLRVSGEVFSALVSTTSFANYRLRVEWRWGENKWPPRAHLQRSSGLVLHSLRASPAFGEGKPWHPGLEFEFQEGSCGDLWVGKGIRVDVPARKARFMGQPLVMYTPGYPLVEMPQADAEPRAVKSNDYERGFGEWNVAEAYVYETNAAFLMNGKLCMQWGNARRVQGDTTVPLYEGPIQLASEGAEIHFRKVALQPLDRLPDRFRLPKVKAESAG